MIIMLCAIALAAVMFAVYVTVMCLLASASTFKSETLADATMCEITTTSRSGCLTTIQVVRRKVTGTYVKRS